MLFRSEVAREKFEMVLIADSPLDCGHAPYVIGKRCVTQALWRAVMGSSTEQQVGDKAPVTDVSWDDCQLFIERLNQRTGFCFQLPTERQWELAVWSSKEAGKLRYGKKGKANSNAKGGVANGEIVATGQLWEWCRDRYTGDPFAYTMTPDIEPEVFPPLYVLRGSTFDVFGFPDEPCDHGFSVPSQRSNDQIGRAHV